MIRDKEKKKVSSAKEAIKQIFENKNYEKFEKVANSRFFIIGVGFNTFSKEIISEIIVKVFIIGLDFEFRKEEGWKMIFEK